jgi:hypothetical protein
LEEIFPCTVIWPRIECSKAKKIYVIGLMCKFGPYKCANCEFQALPEAEKCTPTIIKMYPTNY